MIQDFYNQPFPILQLDHKFYLREQSLDDTQALFEYYSNPLVNQHILITIPTTLTEAMNDLHYAQQLFYKHAGVYWTIAQRSDDHMVGEAGLYINNTHHRAELSYDLDQRYWRQGIMQKALTRITRFAFQQIGLSRIEAIMLKANIPSIALLQKLGYVQEGTLHNYRWFKGKAHNVELMAITPEL